MFAGEPWVLVAFTVGNRSVVTKALRFIDLFAGLGGFHQALASRNAKCVFASELDSELAKLYKANFGIRPKGDIRDVKLSTIPNHDVLCAGFPCQPFSKAGDQKGLECPQWGDLFDYVVAILELKRPRFFIIENVPNLISHNGGKTWVKILRPLRNLKYEIAFERLSPHMFGVPQKRERAFIVGASDGLAGFQWPIPEIIPRTSIKSILDNRPADAHKLNREHILYLKTWQEFLTAFPNDEHLPSFPVWAMEFGANYPIRGATPYSKRYKRLGRYRGAFGQSLAGLSPSEVEAALPIYARTSLDYFPDWKIDFIKKNRAFYMKHRTIIDPWINKIKAFPPSFQKFEWQCRDAKRNLWKHVIQFRASGIRVKKEDVSPSLVAITSQVPIIAWEKRYMTARECSRLQGMDNLKHIPNTKSGAYKAFGNAVNVDVVRNVFDALVARHNAIGSTALFSG